MDEENENFDDAEIPNGESNEDIDDSENEFITENVSVEKQSDLSNDRIGNRVLDNGSDDNDDTPLTREVRQV